MRWGLFSKQYASKIECSLPCWHSRLEQRTSLQTRQISCELGVVSKLSALAYHRAGAFTALTEIGHST